MQVEKWLVKKGDEVKEGDPVCEYSIRGDNFTLTAPYDLRIEEITAEEWDDLEVGQTLAIVLPVNIP
jgi:pyruvate/2-oxoglutarate dehydrogenase complex dihydrolipoamide acyltransferase (E2) component